MGLRLAGGVYFGAPPSAHVAFWGGNGSLSYVDLDARMSIGYTPNRWLGGAFPLSMERSINIVKAAYESLAR